MDRVVDYDKCTGCGACASVCPKGAIKIVQDKDGFYKHEIDQKLCINCGLCQRTCPQISFDYKNNPQPKAYAVMADDEIRKHSSSGGAFSVIAEEFLNKKGVICGAAFDENWVVKHIIVEDEAGLAKLRSSKYLQSRISEDLFKQIKGILEQGRLVLFSGTPCQVAGLYKSLGKDYDNLYTIDIVCAYTPSSKVFGKFLAENYDKNAIHTINFRDKGVFGWACKNIVIEKNNGEKVIDNKYMPPFLGRMYKGEHCVNCAFKRLPRPADFTIGDYWKIQQHTNDCDDGKGTSALIINSPKAEKLFEKLKDKFIKVKEMPLPTISWQIDVKNKIYRTPECKNFFNNFDKKTFNQNIIEAPKESKVGIINWWYVNNRGAILTNYALNEMVKELGYDAYTINFVHPIERKNFPGSFAEDFANKYIKRTRWIDTYNELKTLNNDIGTFICGSDQIFRYFCAAAHSNIFYMGWVDAVKNKLLSYSASFAINKFDATTSQTALVKHWLKRFDNLSVRELDGVDIMRDTFGLKATQVLDPVFCIDKQKYYDMAEKSTDKINEDFIAYYIMWPTEENKKIVEYVKNKLGVSKVVHLNPNMSIENWLWYIQNAKFVVSDSFHASCFSMIFHRQFAIIPNPNEYPSRFLTVDKLCGLSSRFFYNNNDIYNSKDLFEPIDWSFYDEKVGKEVERSVAWLRNALNEPKVNHLNEDQMLCDGVINKFEEDLQFLSGWVWNLEQRFEKSNTELKDLKGTFNDFLQLVKQLVSFRMLKYRIYRLYSHICFGKMHNKYKEKYKKYRQIKNNIDSFKK